MKNLIHVSDDQIVNLDQVINIVHDGFDPPEQGRYEIRFYMSNDDTIRVTTKNRAEYLSLLDLFL
jgi:hypothetical protein